MKIYRYLVVLAFLLAFVTLFGDAAVEENVYVSFEYLTDEDGYNYGAKYFVSSTVNEQVCVCPYIVSQENVYGSVVTCETSNPLILAANESHVSIGQFISADRTKAWSVDVAAKWQKCQ